MTIEIKSFRLWAMIGPYSDSQYLNMIAITRPKINMLITLYAESRCKEIQPGRWTLKKRTEVMRLAIQNPPSLLELLQDETSIGDLFDKSDQYGSAEKAVPGE